MRNSNSNRTSIIATTTTLKEFKQKVALRPYFENAYGFACFQSIAKAAMGIGGARGVGDVWVRKGAGENDYYRFSDTGGSKSQNDDDDDYDHVSADETTIGDKSETSLKKKKPSTTIMEFDDFTLVGKSTMTQLSIGSQFGGKLYSQIVFFETERDFDNFVVNDPKPSKATDAAKEEEGSKTTTTPKKKKTFEFGVDASVVALSASAGANFSTLGNETASVRVAGTDHSYEYRLNDALQYNKGLAVFTVTLAGLMFETCLSGQEYDYKPYKSGGGGGSSGSFRKEGEREDVFASAQREVSTQIENLRNFAKSVSKKWKKEDTTAADADGDDDDDNHNDESNDKDNVTKKTPIDAAVDYKMAGQMAASSSSFSAATTGTENSNLAPAATGERA